MRSTIGVHKYVSDTGMLPLENYICTTTGLKKECYY